MSISSFTVSFFSAVLGDLESLMDFWDLVRLESPVSTVLVAFLGDFSPFLTIITSFLTGDLDLDLDLELYLDLGSCFVLDVTYTSSSENIGFV